MAIVFLYKSFDMHVVLFVQKISSKLWKDSSKIPKSYIFYHLFLFIRQQYFQFHIFVRLFFWIISIIFAGRHFGRLSRCFGCINSINKTIISFEILKIPFMANIIHHLIDWDSQHLAWNTSHFCYKLDFNFSFAQIEYKKNCE